MSNNVTLKALGLNKNANQLEVPPGSMVQASNVIIRRNNVVEPRRGFKISGSLLSNTLSRIKQIFNYKNRLLRHYENKLQFDDGTGFFVDINDTFTETESGLRIKSIETNENLYITTDDGIKKLSVVDADSLETTKPIKAGGIKAVDLTARTKTTVGTGSGILPADTVVAYRALWSIKDANDNLIQGTPSSNTSVYASLQDFIIKDITKLCLNLDTFSNSSLINDKNYTATIASQINSATTGPELRDILGAGPINLCSKLDEDILLTGGGSVLTLAAAPAVVISNGVATVTFTDAPATVASFIQAGDILWFRDFKDATGNDLKYNGPQTITEVTGSTIKFTTSETVATTTNGSIEWGEFRHLYNNASSTEGVALSELSDMTSPTSNQDLLVIQDLVQRIINKIKSANTQVAIISTSDKNLINPSTTTISSNVYLDISIPDEIADAYIDNTYYFLQIYRTKLFNGLVEGNLALEDFINAGGAGDECFLVYEAYPTSNEIVQRKMTVEDTTLDSLSTTPLYTNAQSGEGILQENDRPPFCKDITLFKSQTFYANTRTHYKLQLGLLSVDGLNSDYDGGKPPYFVIARENNTSTAYKFVKGTTGTRDIVVGATGAGLNAKYFTIYPANSFSGGTAAENYTNSLNPKKYVISYNVTSSIATPTADYDGQIVVWVEVPINTLGSTSAIAQRTKDYLSLYPEDFVVSVVGSTITIDNNDYGVNGSSTTSDNGVLTLTDSPGTGEKITAGEIMLYPNGPDDSKALGIESTAKSIVRVLNYNTSETVSAFYISNLNTVPGSFLLENRTLNGSQFYVTIDTNSSTVAGGTSNLSGTDFQPDISNEGSIIATTVSDNTITISTSLTASDFPVGSQIVVFNSNQSDLNGLRTIKTNNAFPKLTLDKTITVTSIDNTTTGCIVRASEVEAASNESKSHRLYYSKLSQPEAVPTLNYLDIGLSGHAIKRIVPLRDSLFIFKEDGLYRLSGSAPFQVSIFDASVVLIAPDSIGITENMIFGWCQQGITTVSEGGSNVISRPIGYDVLLLSSSQYTNFSTITWGVGYTSDNSYIAFTNTETDDTVATIAYRYSNLTETWTTYDISATCGLVNGVDDKLYLGAGDTNTMLQERKTLDRTDYADREYTKTIVSGGYLPNSTQVRLNDVSNIEVGDVLIQTQTLTVGRFNALLQKLDLDSGTHAVDYYSTLFASPGDNLRTKLEALAAKLDSDTLQFNNYSSTIANKVGTILSSHLSRISQTNPTVLNVSSHGLIVGRVLNISGATTNRSINGLQQVIDVPDISHFTLNVNVINHGTTQVDYSTSLQDFRDLVTCFNAIITKLNTDSNISLSNYLQINHNTLQETIITDVNSALNTITVADSLDFIAGEVIVYKAIPSEIIYSPVTAGDPSMTKQFSESSLLFENRNFTSVDLSFSSDLFPGFSSVTLNGDGNGAFGSGKFGLQFFGGVRNSAPLRTYVPTYAQKCTYINVKMNHSTAREKYSLFGNNLKFRPISTRAYWK